MMDRRVFVTMVSGSILALPLADAGHAGKVWRIGYPTDAEVGNPLRSVFLQRLRELGYVEGQNVALEVRSVDGRPERYPSVVAELVRLRVDVIVASSNHAIAAAQKATTSIPIVMVITSDPVADGFVTSLARPGGNITGVTVQSTDVVGKRLQLLKEAVPALSRVAVLQDPGYPGAQRTLREVKTATTALGLQLKVIEVRSARDLEGAVDAAAGGRAGALFISAGTLGFTHRVRIGKLAVKHRLPALGLSQEYAEAGLLMGHGPSYADQFRRAGDFVDRILKGTKPAELPVEQPTKFYLTVNLKTAKAIGLTIPPSVLGRADQVIE